MFSFQPTDEFSKELARIVRQEIQAVLRELAEAKNENPISAKELRQRLGISKATELRYQKAGYLRPLNFGRRVFYVWSEVIESLKGQSIELLPRKLRKAQR